MQTEQLNRLKRWFATYTRSFLTGDTATDSPLTLKIEHTERVGENITHLGHSIELTDAQLCTAQTIALFHDVGRFTQYRRYQTFNDRQSANHAALGIGELEKHAVLTGLPDGEKALIEDAIRFHNAPTLPGSRPAASMLFMRLIRDADKLDIWKVFADYHRQRHHPAAAILQDLPDKPYCSDTIVDAVIDKRMANFQDMKTQNDFKLLQLSWVFDLNYPESLVQAQARGDLAVIAQALPDEPAIHQAITGVMDHLAQRKVCLPT